MTSADVIHVYDLDGNELSTTVVPFEGAATESRLRGVSDVDGTSYVYRGTFTPSLVHYDAMGDLVAETLPGWSTANNVTYGGLTHTADWVWATDMVTAGAAETGVVRFSLSGLPAERVAASYAFIDVETGLDGLVYALHSNGTSVYPLDPMTGDPGQSLTLGSSIRALAVDVDGTVYGASFGGSVFEFDAQGDIVTTLNVGTALADISLASDGTIAVGASANGVYLTDSAITTAELLVDLATGSAVFVDLREDPT